MVFRTDESVMFMEVSLIQRCPDSTEARKGHPLQFTIAVISILGA